MQCRCLQCQSVSDIPLARLKVGQAKMCKECARKNLVAGHAIANAASKDGTLVTAIDGRRKLNKNSTTGIKGVSYNEKHGTYRAYISFKRKQYHLGTYGTLVDAAEARQIAEKALYGDFLKWYKNEYPEQWEKLEKTKNKKRPS